MSTARDTREAERANAGERSRARYSATRVSGARAGVLARREPADRDALVPELARLDVLVEAEMRRVRARYELTQDELHGLYVTDERVAALLRPQAERTDAAAVPDAAVARATDRVSRWRWLAEALDLDDDGRDVLLACLAPELDRRYETLYAYLNDDVTRRWPTPELVARLLGRDPEHVLALRGLMQPGAELFEQGALELAAPGRDEPRGLRALRAAAPLADWVQGCAYSDERLRAVTRPASTESQIPDGALPRRMREALGGVVRSLAASSPLPALALSAESAAEAALVAEELFARANRAALVLDLAALRTAATRDDVLRALELAQRVLGLGVVATPLDALVGSAAANEECVAAVRRLARRAPALILAGSASARADVILEGLPALDLGLPRPDVAERAAAWRGALGTAAEPALVEALADRFALGNERIRRAALAARDAASIDAVPRPTAAHIFRAARTCSGDGSGGTTRVVTTAFEWDDLVLPPEAKARLADLVHAIERRSQVLETWGFALSLGVGRGVNAMFAGPSGTGKTMAAGIVAKALQLDLHCLELGAVVSKYIGETEKNLDRAFDAASRANAVLLIDEADALLGKRSQVRDAHDRYANVEIAYLLQKLEDHDGVVIVATNLAQNVDEAFSRRMQFVIEFPLPDAAGRERLWRRMLAPKAPLAADVDCAALGRQFELTGGEIRNVVLDAACRAAQEGGMLTLCQLLRAVARQYVKRGKVPTQTEFREFYPLLSADGGP